MADWDRGAYRVGKIGDMRFILPAMMDLSGRWRGAFTI